MKEFHHHNNKLFVPFQPSVLHSEQNVQYKEVCPADQLGNYIFCYWQLKSDMPLSEPYFYRVIADGCIDIIISCYHPYESRIMGFSNEYNIFSLGKSFNYVGIRFLPGAFPYIFNCKASELTNKMEVLHLLFQNYSKEIGQIVENKFSLEEIKTPLDFYFLKLLTNLPLKEDKRLWSAINTILVSQGNLTIENDIDVGLSVRQLRRLFEFYIGDSPKSFSRVVRFQSLLRTIVTRREFLSNKDFYNFGYYDQSHFIKEFNRFYGLSPYCISK